MTVGMAVGVGIGVDVGVGVGVAVPNSAFTAAITVAGISGVGAGSPAVHPSSSNIESNPAQVKSLIVPLYQGRPLTS